MEEEQIKLKLNDCVYTTLSTPKFRNRKPYHPKDNTDIQADIAGSIIQIKVKVGDEIKKGTELLCIEAMKMQNSISSAYDGKIKEILVKEGEKVTKGSSLIKLG